MRSIRQFLVANLLIGVLFATNLAILSNLYFGYKSIRPHLDAQMVIMAHSIDAFLNEDNKPYSSRNSIHAKVEHYAAAIQSIPYDDLLYLEDLHRSLDTIQFKVYNAQGMVIARSPNAPQIKKQISPGFGSIVMNGEKWRTFKLSTSHKKTIVIVS